MKNGIFEFELASASYAILITKIITNINGVDIEEGCYKTSNTVFNSQIHKVPNDYKFMIKKLSVPLFFLCTRTFLNWICKYIYGIKTHMSEVKCNLCASEKY